MATPFTIEDVVDVVISLSARPITQTGFETPLILASHNVFADRIATYSDLDSVVSAGFAAGSGVYELASRIFSGNAAPSTIKVGRRGYTETVYSVDTVVEGDVVSINIEVDGNSFTTSYTVGAAEDNTDAATAIQTAIEADGVVGPLVIATDNLDGTITIAPTTSEALSVGAGSNSTVTSTASENVATALAAIADVDADWFFIVSDTRVDQDILDIASYAESNKKMYITSTNNADVITSATTDIVSQLQDLQYDNTFVLVAPDADAEYGEGAIIGARASFTPGSGTLHGATLKGVTVASYSRTEADFAESKNGNIYSLIAGVGFLKEGKMVSGQYFDIIRGTLYLEARMQEDLFQLIKNKADRGQKVPFTDGGIAMVAGVMNRRLVQSVDEGFLASTPAPVVIRPLASSISAVDKANRLLPNVPFEATLAGAIHTVKIRGYLEV